MGRGLPDQVPAEALFIFSHAQHFGRGVEDFREPDGVLFVGRRPICPSRSEVSSIIAAILFSSPSACGGFLSVLY